MCVCSVQSDCWGKPVENWETLLIAMVALTLSILMVLGWIGWWLHSTIVERAEETEERGSREEEALHEQQVTLARLSMEVHHARAELLSMRKELETHTYGPPSLRQPCSSPGNQ